MHMELSKFELISEKIHVSSKRATVKTFVPFVIVEPPPPLITKFTPMNSVVL